MGTKVQTGDAGTTVYITAENWLDDLPVVTGNNDDVIIASGASQNIAGAAHGAILTRSFLAEPGLAKTIGSHATPLEIDAETVTLNGTGETHLALNDATIVEVLKAARTGTLTGYGLNLTGGTVSASATDQTQGNDFNNTTDPLTLATFATDYTTVVTKLGIVGERIIIESEIIRITAIAGNSYTFSRGSDGTTTATHANSIDVKTFNATKNDLAVIRAGTSERIAIGAQGMGADFTTILLESGTLLLGTGLSVVTKFTATGGRFDNRATVTTVVITGSAQGEWTTAGTCTTMTGRENARININSTGTITNLIRHDNCIFDFDGGGTQGITVTNATSYGNTIPIIDTNNRVTFTNGIIDNGDAYGLGLGATIDIS